MTIDRLPHREYGKKPIAGFVSLKRSTNHYRQVPHCHRNIYKHRQSRF